MGFWIPGCWSAYFLLFLLPALDDEIWTLRGLPGLPQRRSASDFSRSFSVSSPNDEMAAHNILDDLQGKPLAYLKPSPALRSTNDPLLSLSSYKPVASYNWVESPDPTLVVPGESISPPST